MMTTAVKKNIKLEAQVKRAPVKKKSGNAKTPAKKKPIRRKKRGSKKAGGWKWRLFKWACLLALMGFLVLFGYVFYCYVSMPDIQKAVNRTREPSTVIMAQNGNDIAKFGNVYARVIAPDRLPENLTAAVVATEDRRFYQHFGFDVWGFGRAMATNIFHRRYAQGASTITQQVAKNIFLTQGKTIKRKVQELLLAFWLENKLSKNQIMALYLNRVYFGSGLYGADAAANWYFNKSVYDLNVREAAVLAGLLKAPSRYNPILNKKAALSRADVVLKSMRDSGYLSQREYQNARALPISDGQKQLTMLARAIAQEPDIMILDEPTSFLDIRHKIKLLGILKKLVFEKNMAVIMSLHELELAHKCADHILCIGNGRVDRYGTAEEIFDSNGYIEELYGVEKGCFIPEYASVELGKTEGEPEVFVIGGGGSGIPVYRKLQREGIPFAAGVIHENDIEYPVAKALACKVVTEKAFMPIGDESYEEAAKLMAQCKKVIPAVKQFAVMNEKNGELISEAEKRGLIWHGL